jgi:hypothetical protein
MTRSREETAVGDAMRSQDPAGRPASRRELPRPRDKAQKALVKTNAGSGRSKARFPRPG